MEHEDISILENHESGQKKPDARRDKVVVTKVTEKELSIIKKHGGAMRHETKRFHPGKGSRLQTKTETFKRGAGRPQAARGLPHGHGDFANALRRLDDREKVRLFHHRPTMLEWYEKVAHVTDRVADFLQSAQTANSLPAGTTNGNNKEDNP